MVTITVRFIGCVQDMQEVGGNDAHMLSRVAFDLDVDGTKHQGLHVIVKQTAGSDYENSPLEVGSAVGYHGPFNHEAFQREVESYYRSVIGNVGLFHVAPGARMRNNRFIIAKTVTFPASGESSSVW